jgi:hypothetical protein
MIKFNCIVTIKRLIGDENNKTYQDVLTGVRLLLMPTSTEIAAMYEVPVGSSYSFIVMDQIETIEPADKIIITDPLTSGRVVNDEFIVRGNSIKGTVLGKTINQGVCIKT